MKAYRNCFHNETTEVVQTRNLAGLDVLYGDVMARTVDLNCSTRSAT